MKKTETERLREWMRDQEQSALSLLHQALVDIALDYFRPEEIARAALKRLAEDYPEVVEYLLVREATMKRRRRAA